VETNVASGQPQIGNFSDRFCEQRAEEEHHMNWTS
jgi:hypothetical protein